MATPTRSVTGEGWLQRQLSFSGSSAEDPESLHPREEQRKEETLETLHPPRHFATSSRPATQADGDEEIVIACIRAKDVTLGLRRLPAGFYAVVHHSGLEWRTENRRSSVNDDVIKWDGPIPIPRDPSATVCLVVFASFEFEPMLGAGEQLRKLTATAGQLLDRSARDAPFTFFPKDGDVVSPCSSIFVTIKRRKCDSCASLVSGPHSSTGESRGNLGDVTNQGHSALSRYRKHGEKRDLARSVQEFERALKTCPLDHPCRPVAQSNLATAKFILNQAEDSDSDVPVNLYRNALSARPIGHVDRPSTLILLAAVHSARFEKKRDETEKARVEALLKEAMELSSTESYEHQAASFALQVHAARKVPPAQAKSRSSAGTVPASRLTNANPWILSVQLMERYKESGDLADLQEAIITMECLVRYTSMWDPRYCGVLGNLGLALSLRFEHLGELQDLEDAISKHRDIINLTPDGHHDKPAHLSHLGSLLRVRSERLGELRDLEEAIFILNDAEKLAPSSHSHRPGCLANLGGCLHTRFSRLGKLRDLEDAISKLRDAVDLIPREHANTPNLLNNLGTCLLARFDRLGELSDLNHAISMLRDTVNLTPQDHPHMPGHLHNLGNSLITRYERLGVLSDIDDAIMMLASAVDLIPSTHRDKPACLNALGSALKARFDRVGELSDLEAAIPVLRDGVDLIPRGDPSRSICLNNLGNSFRARFQHVGDPNDIDSAISSLSDAAHLIPYGHPQRPTYLNNLAYAFSARFGRFGELGDVENAISTLKEVVTLTPDDDPSKYKCLSNLAYSSIARFDRLREPSDVENAISSFRDAVAFIPYDHPDRSNCLTNLGGVLMTRFEFLQEPKDLDDAISVLEHAADVTPHVHPNKPSCFNNLGIALITRFQCCGELSDLEAATLRYADAVKLTPDGHPGKVGRLRNFANCLVSRFEHFKELSDLESAISILHYALQAIPDGHYNKPHYLSDLSHAFITRFEFLGESNDIEQAISTSAHAASSPAGSVRVRFGASGKWISYARRISHPSLLRAYSVAIHLLPQLAWIGVPLEDRYAPLLRGANVVREAAAAALDAGLPEIAVEWLEQGRSIVWGELFQLRDSHGELSSAYPDHARRLRELSAALEAASAAHEKSLFERASRTTNPMTVSSPQEADRHRALAIERDKLLQEIRGFAGFERFLLKKKFSQLRASAHSGPVVILNAAEQRCDALIVLANVDHVIHVPLPTFTFKRSTGLQNMLEELLGYARSVDREGRIATRGGISWESLLSTLWDGVVKPVLNALAVSAPDEPFRLFWCPTGPFSFLPIHAAGFYDAQHSQPEHKVSDFVVSSYIPTLSILMLPSSRDVTLGRGLRLLAVRQPPTDGLSRLPGVASELEHIKAIIRASPSARTTLLESSQGTVEEVLALMQDADWVHFACHGIQQGMMTGLCLADGCRLKLLDMIALSRPRGGLAFLSACQTATGEEWLSDEAIHVAAGMLFAGYGGVIGTMWSISDKLAPEVARDVYEQLFREGVPDHREAAFALHRAVGRLRSSGRASFVTWLPFIHVGL